MAQIHFYVPQPIEAKIRRRAQAAGLSLSRYVADLVQRQIGDSWPANYFERIVGGWQGQPLERSPQGAFEQREKL